MERNRLSKQIVEYYVNKKTKPAVFKEVDEDLESLKGENCKQKIYKINI